MYTLQPNQQSKQNLKNGFCHTTKLSQTAHIISYSSTYPFHRPGKLSLVQSHIDITAGWLTRQHCFLILIGNNISLFGNEYKITVCQKKGESTT
jgi:hypothetical protein